MSSAGVRSGRVIAAAQAAGWTSFFDVDVAGLRGHGREAAVAFSRTLHQALPGGRFSDTARRTLLIEARRATHPTGQQYALVALETKVAEVLNALRAWKSPEVKTVFEALEERWQIMVDEDRFNLDFSDVAHWIHTHDDDEHRADAVAVCIKADVPIEVRIHRRLPQTGSQKIVFEGVWTVADDPTDIVLKQFFADMREKLRNELRPHPLSMRHPNIIETYALANQARNPEVFLVERRIEPITGPASGESEAARLFVDMTRALAFLEDQGLVHGDIKPDNIAFADGRFILLDFGICRPEAEFLKPDVTATGSLRTRAPELLFGRPQNARSDVWALGATVFNALFRRFPLWHFDDPPLPRLQDDRGERAEAEGRMRERIETDYEAHLEEIQKIQHRGLRTLLRGALDQDPATRSSAAELLATGLRELPSLVGTQEGPRFDPRDELVQLKRHLSADDRDLELMSHRERRDLAARLALLNRAIEARRHYRHPARALARAATAAAAEMDSDSQERIFAERVAARVDRHLARADKSDDLILVELQARIDRMDGLCGSGRETEQLDEDLSLLLQELAASSLHQKLGVAEAAQALERLLPTNP